MQLLKYTLFSLLCLPMSKTSVQQESLRDVLSVSYTWRVT